MRDSDLVRQALAGAKAALGALLDRHRPMAWRLAFRLLEDAAEADDVVQEACLQALVGLARLRAPDRFGAWLAGIALNLARMRLRARRATVAWEDWDGGRLAAGFTADELSPSPEAAYELRELHARVMHVLADLPPEQQSVLRLHYLEGLTLSEIGILTGAPLGTVKARLHRGRQRLRARLLGGPDKVAAEQRPKEVATMIEMKVQDVLMRVPRPGAGQAPDIVYLYSARRDAPPTAGEPVTPFQIPVPPPSPPDVLEAAGRAVPSPGAEPVRVPLPPPGPGQFVVVLQERDGSRVLPIWIGPHEGQMLKWQLTGGSAPRPLTYELMARLLEASGSRVERVAVSRLQEKVFYATLWLQAGGRTTEVDARPSDALNLALRLGVPIFVDVAVLAEAGVPADGLTQHLNTETERDRAAGGPLAEVEWVWLSAPGPEFGVPPPAK